MLRTRPLLSRHTCPVRSPKKCTPTGNFQFNINSLRVQISLLFHILVKCLPFYIPEAWKWYPFLVEPPYIRHYKEYNRHVSRGFKSTCQNPWKQQNHKWNAMKTTPWLVAEVKNKMLRQQRDFRNIQTAYCLGLVIACYWLFWSIDNIQFFTSSEREVKDSRRSAMYQSWYFWDKIGHAKSVGFGFIRLFDEVRAELVRNISRSLRFLWFTL